MIYRVSIVTEYDDNGYFAYSPELPGCIYPRVKPMRKLWKIFVRQ